MGHFKSPRALDNQPASWRTLPQKQQLFILTLCRLFDYMQVVSFQTVCYYQLKSFDSTISEQTLSWQAGVASGVFSGAQILTSMIWGRIADASWCGRKKVLLIGLMGTGFSCLGLAFSRSFNSVVGFRFMAGAFHVTIGTVRTIMSENTQEKKHQARAFLLLPAAVMVASILGSVCASRLADPFAIYPGIMDAASKYGSGSWVAWMKIFPYAPPALMGAISIVFIGLVASLTIEETLESRQYRPNLAAAWRRDERSQAANIFPVYDALTSGLSTQDVEASLDEQRKSLDNEEPRSTRIVWKFNILVILFAQAIFDFHMGGFDSLLPLFLSTPRSSAAQRFPFVFSGGLGMEPRKVATALTMVGCIGLALQFVFYPTINSRLGNVKTFRIFCIAFPVAYCLAPYLVIVPASQPFAVWTLITLVLTIHTAGRIFVLPVTIALLNNCAADASVLGTIHGLGQTTTAIFRTAGPVSAGSLFGASLELGSIRIVWWVMAIIAMFGWVASLFVWESKSSTRAVAVEAVKMS